MGWPATATKRLRALWAEGKSIAECAARMGPDFSRSKIAGKLHRLGLTDDNRQGDANATERRANRVKAVHRMAENARYHKAKRAT